jgi:hypothetical protein
MIIFQKKSFIIVQHDVDEYVVIWKQHNVRRNNECKHFHNNNVQVRYI